MKEIVFIFWFIFIFLLITGIVYHFVLLDKNFEQRLNYYLDINKRYKDFREKKSKPQRKMSLLTESTEFIRKKLRGELSYEKQQEMNQMLMGAGLNLRPEEYIMIRWFLAIIIGGILYLLLNNIIILIVGAISGYICPKIWIKNKRKKRLQKFNEALPDVINTIIGSLRSGYSLPQAMKTVSEESESPIREEIILLLKEINYGITMDEALDNLNTRMPSIDLEIMIQAILIQRQVGGNLSNILEIIAKTIRERIKLERKVRTLTSQGRISGKVIGVLPIFIAFILYLFNPNYITDFWGNIIGKIAIAVCIFSEIIGFIVIDKITKIEV